MSTKAIKQSLQSLRIPLPYSSIPPVTILPISPTSISTCQPIDNRLKLNNKMHRSLKPKITLPKPKSQLYNKLDIYSIHKGKKFSDSYYYKNENKCGQMNQQCVIYNKRKGNGIQNKFRNHSKIISGKNSKSKLMGGRKNQKIKTEPNIGENCISSKHRSLHKLIASLSGSQNLNKFKTLRTFSPQIQLISQQLSHKHKSKKISQKQQDIYERLSKVLEEYKQTIIKERKDKNILLKENKRLKEKLQMLNSEKKYRTVQQYNV